MTDVLQAISGKEVRWFRAGSIALLILFLAVGAFLSFRHQTGVVFPDEKEYFELAENLREHGFLTWDGEDPTASRPPGFVFWLAILGMVGLGWSGMVAANFAILAIGIWVLSGVWFRPERKWAGRFAVLLLLFCYPVTIYVCSTLYPQAFCFFLISVSLALLLRSAEGRWRAVVAGVLMGWCTLTAPMYLTWVGILALVPILRFRTGGVLPAVVFVMVAGLATASWGIRNHQTMGKFVPFSTNSGYNLLAGNCEFTRPNAGLNIDLSRWETEVQSRGMDEIEADAYYSAEAKRWILENPGSAAAMYFQKFLNYFNFRNELIVRSAGSSLRDAVMFATYYSLLAVLVIRLVSSWPEGRTGWKEWLLVLGYLACAMLTSVVMTRIRYRVPCDVLLFFVVAPVVYGTVRLMATKLVSRLPGRFR